MDIIGTIIGIVIGVIIFLIIGRFREYIIPIFTDLAVNGIISVLIIGAIMYGLNISLPLWAEGIGTIAATLFLTYKHMNSNRMQRR